MISVLLVEVGGCKNHLKISCDSIVKRSKMVSNIIIAVADSDSSLDETWKENNICFNRISVDMCGQGLWFGHSLGLHAALAKSSTDYVIFNDPDCFWHSAIDEFYLGLMNQHNLDFVGVSHHNAVNQSYKFFPCVMNVMARKSRLPDETWLEDNLKFRSSFLHRGQLTEEDKWPSARGKYLIPNPLPVQHQLFPNQDELALFDVGCNLWLYNEAIKGRWLSFQTQDCHLYTSKYYRSNFGFKDRLPNLKLLYHLGSGSRNHPPEFEMFKNAYEQSGDQG